ncbi:MAG: DUF4157 domain-containing protein [Undibacterium sp.]|nr:DUF4157 domain-containing protein [Undibacterium sp.]
MSIALQLKQVHSTRQNSVTSTTPSVQATAPQHATVFGPYRYSNSPIQAANRNKLTNHNNNDTAKTPSKHLPTQLKSGIESLSGVPLDDVKVHYNSDRPALFNALAYAQGREIHLARGQERHLPHEAWHLVQQAQNRVKSSTQMADVAINTNSSLETEADVMGSKALSYQTTQSPTPANTHAQEATGNFNGSAPVQLKVDKYRAGAWFSSFDPYTTFWTKKEATDYDKKLRNQGREELKARVPTIYTYTHTKPGNKLSFALQGPHTVAHRVVLQSLINATTVLEVHQIFHDQVLDPSDAEEVVFTDEAPPSGSFSSTLEPRLERFVADYTSIYDENMLEFAKTSPDLIKLKHMTNQLINMDPYAVYAWKTTNQASKKSLSGKGESVAKPTWSDLYDKPPSSSFRDDDNLQSFVDSRKDLFNSNF